MTPEQFALAEKNLSNPAWRIESLYSILDKRGNQIKFRMNSSQRELFYNLHTRNTVLKCRQIGISTFCLILLLDRLIFNSGMSAGVISYSLEEAEVLFRRLKFAFDNLPPAIKELRTCAIDRSREMIFSNGSSIRVATSLRGSSLQLLHVSELGALSVKSPTKAQEVLEGAMNTLPPDGFAIVESTAAGREGVFFDLCQRAQELQEKGVDLGPLDQKFFFFPWHQELTYRIGSAATPITPELHEYFQSLKSKGIELTQEQQFWYGSQSALLGDSVMKEFPSLPGECFWVSEDGAYYSRQLTAARIEKRIGRIPFDPTLPVHTAWDLGFSDQNAIWIFQISGREIYCIDYIEGSGESLSHWLSLLQQRAQENGWAFDRHLAPHDVLHTEYTSGMSRQASARKLGFTLTAVPRLDVQAGIDQVRNIFSRCWFDAERCAAGIKCLENYRKEWDSNRGCWSSRPRHDWASHGSDAFRTLATGLSLVKRQVDARSLGLRNTNAEESPRFYGRFQSNF